MPIQIHPDLQSLIPPLTPEESAQLEANLLAAGCLDPLIVWQETQLLLDGHNRYAICERHGLTYRVQDISLPDLDAAKAWLISHQVGRRNLALHQLAYLWGSLYLRHKQQGKRTDLTSAQSEQKLPDTATALGRQVGVSAATIRRYADYAQAVDVLATTIGPIARQALLDREWHATRDEVERFAALASESPEYVEAVRTDLVRAAQAPFHRATYRAFFHSVDLTQRGAPRKFCPTCGRARTHADALISQIPVCPGHPQAPAEQDAPPPQAAPSPPILTEVQEPELPEAAPSWQQQVYTGDYEWYTPDEVLTPVRAVLGTIDVDPASCAAAQEVVQAHTFYTLETDGLRQPWPGTVFLNPPYKLPDVARFIGKLCQELDAGRTTAAILLVNNATETDWFQRAFMRADAVCFPDGKIRFVHATRNSQAGPCVGQVLLYYGPDPLGFCTVFATLGVSTWVVCADVAPPQLVLAAAAD